MTLPKSGGAIRGIGEKFTTNPSNGTASLAVPIATSTGRAGFDLQLALSYDSGSGNGPFGMGWHLSVPAITRKTDKGLPRYLDHDDSDVIVLAGAEDLVPELREGSPETRGGYEIRRYRPRVEGLCARIERWTRMDSGEIHWRVTTRDNVLNIYGRTGEARIADPDHDRCVFSWLLEETRDDHGNVVHYIYKPEDDVNVARSKASEANRFERKSDGAPRFLATGQRYLKRIRYGNRAPVERSAPVPDEESDWLFEVVFDYGEHDPIAPTPAETSPWPVREDPFSTYRAGFEVRTYRLCRRVLMFHRFEELTPCPCLVRSTDFSYDSPAEANALVATHLRSVTHAGYKWNADKGPHIKATIPPLEFEYTRPVLHDEPRPFDTESLGGIPAGVEGTGAQWVDLDGEGIPGVLQSNERAWYYKANLGGGRLAPPTLLRPLPAPAELRGGAQHLSDLDGNGQLDLVRYSPPLAGYFERTPEGDWDPFVALPNLPNLDWKDPALRFVDLDGDGHPDVLITEQEVFVWYRSRAKDGFEPPVFVTKPWDESKGPAVIFADGTETLQLADMSGDGLVDIVRVRNGEVCYWPNLGYGRFGRKVTLEGSPWFDTAELFDPRRIRFADVDGSGTSDVLYLGHDGIAVFFNRSGNALSSRGTVSRFSGGEQVEVLEDQVVIRTLPLNDAMTSISVADVLGQGTACIVWSSVAPASAGRPLAYIDLMGGRKPHLLATIKNNLGAETHIRYAPSTRFYLADKREGKPWVTRLAFPVQVVERVETVDRVSRNRFYTRYAYHHGYFDGYEREFRGFGMVEQWDTEELGVLREEGALPPEYVDETTYKPPAPGDNFDLNSYVPPMVTRTWFHTGAFLDQDRISQQFTQEYYREPSLRLTGPDDPAKKIKEADFADRLLPDTVLPPGLTAAEMREACRALKGSILRQEVYGLDPTERAEHPYTVSERNYDVRRLQAPVGERHGVFLVSPREALEYHYERDPSDPRVVHSLTLDVDVYGNVKRAASVAYGRVTADADLLEDARGPQREILATLTRTDFTTDAHDPSHAAIDMPDAWRTPLPYQTRTYEIVQLRLPPGRTRFTLDEVSAATNAPPVPYEAAPATNTLRLIEHEQTLYRRDDLSGPLPLGQIQARATPYESYKLAFTRELVAQIFDGRVDDGVLESGGYVHGPDDDPDWWIPSGRVYFSPGKDTPAQELAFAKQHFHLPWRRQVRFGDPPGDYDATVVGYDRYDLLIAEMLDGVGNVVRCEEYQDSSGNVVKPGERSATDRRIWSGLDYRVLQPVQVMDPNGNRTAVAVDALGMVVGTAVMGKRPPAKSEGDSLDDFDADMTSAEFEKYLEHLANPHANLDGLLRGATTRLIHDLFAYQRTQNKPTPQGPTVHTLVRETHAADLTGATPSKVQHAFTYSDGFGREIQKKVQAEPGPIVDKGPEVAPRWVGSGWTIYNNKGKPVRKYEPFFSATHDFEFAKKVGVSSTMFYDPASRVVATLHPDHTWEKVVFSAWHEERWDANDTVLVSDPKSDLDVWGFFKRLLAAEYLPSWYDARAGGALGDYEQAAAHKASVHRETPTTVHLDTLGRPFVTVARNRYERDHAVVEDPPYVTRTVLDIEGNEREVIDALGRVVMRYEYDMLGHRVRQASMDAGERRTLSAIDEKPLRAWDSRGHTFQYEHDRARRPTKTHVLGAIERAPDTEVLYEETIYGEGQTDDVALNLRTRVYMQRDAAGVVTNQGVVPGTDRQEAYDFKGNLLRSVRELAARYWEVVNWEEPVPLEGSYATATRYDALNRPIETTTPDQSRTVHTYNEAGLLETVQVMKRGTATTERIINNIDYDAKGQRKLVEYDNGARTQYEYDEFTFRLTHLKTTRRNGTETMQDLWYVYDPVGNITRITDSAQWTIYVRNSRVEPGADYTYDAIYRLIEATGREHRGLLDDGTTGGVIPTTFDDAPRVGRPHPNDGRAMGTYTERYIYDAVGNILHMIHRRVDPAHSGWTRDYEYNEANNQLIRTDANAGSGHVSTYTHDAHGNMTFMQHLPLMKWNCRDQLMASARQVVGEGGKPETTYYVYDAAGQRVRKVTAGPVGSDGTPMWQKERVYLGQYEVYRESASGLTRETLHVMDDKRRVAMIETRTAGTDRSPEELTRYQFDNHLGSACLELDGTTEANVVSYEEYYPYGGTSCQGVSGVTEVTKRYRYTGKERDEESGLYYHGARYYAPWLGRWTSCDPIGIANGGNLYDFVTNAPITFIDPNGRQEVPYGEEVFSKIRPTSSHCNHISKMKNGDTSKDLPPKTKREEVVWQLGREAPAEGTAIWAVATGRGISPLFKADVGFRLINITKSEVGIDILYGRLQSEYGRSGYSGAMELGVSRAELKFEDSQLKLQTAAADAEFTLRHTNAETKFAWGASASMVGFEYSGPMFGWKGVNATAGASAGPSAKIAITRKTSESGTEVGARVDWLFFTFGISFHKKPAEKAHGNAGHKPRPIN